MENQRILVHILVVTGRTLIHLLGGGALLAMALLTGGAFCQVSATEISKARRSNLKWIFEEDPRTLGLKIDDAHSVIKFRALKKLSISIGRNAKIASIDLNTKISSFKTCNLTQGTVVWLSLKIPDDYARQSPFDPESKIYNFENLYFVKPNRNYYAIIQCQSPKKLSYIEK